MKIQQYYGTGRRKSSIACVYLVPGSGEIVINKKNINEYLLDESLKRIICQPLVVTKNEAKFDMCIKVKGGGFSGQAEAIRMGVARALLEVDSDSYRSILKSAKFLTRDSRIKERKKPGLKKARRAPQFSKR